ncbi:hypothetical protein BJP08_07400 [Corynebacterium sp. NML140438]|nr:hypothetical protein BJP08_07400 [Corynebacterium sp. NML140438]
MVQIMGDILGPWSAHIGIGAGDLGTMTPLNEDEFAMVFGDSFRGRKFGEGDWISPIGVVARMKNGQIEILRPLNGRRDAYGLINYFREEGDNLTLIPSDVININGTLYMQGMWNRGIGNVLDTQFWKSTDEGKTWKSIGRTPNHYLNGLGQLISWEKGPDGYIYAVMSGFQREHPVYLARFTEAQIGDQPSWELFDPDTGEWGNEAGAILFGDHVKAGEMNLRYIDNHWVFVMFNEATLAIEVRISDRLPQSWNDVPVATIAKNGYWDLQQTPMNFSQPYGGYIVPGSTIANLDVVISQWNTNTNERYMSTQFNVKGLDTFFGIDPESMRPHDQDNIDVNVTPNPPQTDDMDAEDNLMSSEGSSKTKAALITVGVLAGLGLIGAVAWPTIRQYLPPQLQQLVG